MQALKVATIAMGVLIVVGTVALGVVIAQRLGGSRGPARIGVASLDEPDGTRIAAIASVQDRLALLLQGGGPDRVVLIDPRTGARTGFVGVAR